MTLDENEELRRENRQLRERLSRLSEASLRINDSLDFETVMQEVVDSARTLVGSRYGGMAVFQAPGELQAFVTSGFDAEEQQQFMNLPEGQALFTHFSTWSEPLRIRDFNALVRSLGFPGLRLPMRVSDELSFLAAPILHRGEYNGSIYLAEKEGAEEFTQEDQETLVMFASQAALVIANARRHRDELRARTDLETLIDTSPVGVVVFDGGTGAPVSFNREAVRIFTALQTPNEPLEQLLEVMTIQRGDGRTISLEEVPVAQTLSMGETVRAEEIAVSGARRPECESAHERHGNPFGGGRGGDLRGDPPGHEAAGGARAAARRVPGDGQPRAAHAADFHQGLGLNPAGPVLLAASRRDAPVLPHHRRSGRAHARPDQRPPRRGAHRDGHPARGPRAGGPGWPLWTRRRPPS